MQLLLGEASLSPTLPYISVLCHGCLDRSSWLIQKTTGQMSFWQLLSDLRSYPTINPISSMNNKPERVIKLRPKG
jgi:hypothetical protein